MVRRIEFGSVLGVGHGSVLGNGQFIAVQEPARRARRVLHRQTLAMESVTVKLPLGSRTVAVVRTLNAATPCARSR